MNLFVTVVVTVLVGGVASLSAADVSTSSVDYTDRNDKFAPGESRAVKKDKPVIQETLQEKRVTPPKIDKQPAAVGERRAAIDVREKQTKKVREKEVLPSKMVEHQVSDLNHRSASISTVSGAQKPATVAKYQDHLTAASAANMARFPAMDRATSARINRFVFRKNAPEPEDVLAGAPVVPAAGGSAVRK